MLCNKEDGSAHGCRRPFRALIACLLLGILSGCGTPANSVIVDNTTDTPMVVELNGHKAIEIRPRDFGSISCMPGQYQVRVTSNDQEVYRGQHTLESSEHLLRPRIYLLNPANNSGYTVATVEYGSSNMVTEGVMEGLIALGEHSHNQKLDENTRTFISLKHKTRPIPDTPWFEAKGAYYLLQQPPKSVATKIGRVEYYPVLTRISKNDQKVINRAHSIKAPSLNDLMSLNLATNRAFQSLSDLAPPPGQSTNTNSVTSNQANDSI